MRDFLLIMQGHNYYRDDRWNRTDYIYTFETGSKIEFFSADQPDKVRGPRRDRLFLNEANNIDHESFDQLEVRTKEFIFLDWNPTNEFWFYTEVKNRGDVDHITLTYRDNEALDKNIVESIERRQGNKNWWQVYGLGQLGEVENRIYSGWEIIDDLPHEARLERYGLDFGYTNDPTAIVGVYAYNGGFILDEAVYRKGLSNRQIADLLLNIGKSLTIADSAEPKSIDEIKDYGIDIIPCAKGPGSVSQGIQYVKDQKISVTKRSTNLIKEYRNYLWRTDRDGKIINEPEGGNDHCLHGDTVLMTAKGERKISDLVGEEGYLVSVGGSLQKFSNVRMTQENAELVEVSFSDGSSIKTTQDHLFLRSDNVWIPASSLCSSDMIQSVTYGKDYIGLAAGILRRCLQEVPWRNVLQVSLSRSWHDVSTPCCVGACAWRDTAKDAYTPCRRGQEQQSDREPSSNITKGTCQRTHDRGETPANERKRGEDKTTNKEVARLRGGEEVACRTWKDRGVEYCSYPKKVRALLKELYQQSIMEIGAVLQSELQNESATKTVERVSRVGRANVYNLEVDWKHCFLANGVIVHNCLDAVRYALESYRPRVEYPSLPYSFAPPEY